MAEESTTTPSTSLVDVVVAIFRKDVANWTEGDMALLLTIAPPRIRAPVVNQYTLWKHAFKGQSGGFENLFTWLKLMLAASINLPRLAKAEKDRSWLLRLSFGDVGASFARAIQRGPPK